MTEIPPIFDILYRYAMQARINDNLLLLTIYFPVTDLGRKDLRHKVKALCELLFHDNHAIRRFSYLEVSRVIEEDIIAKIMELPEMGKGIAIFALIDMSDIEHEHLRIESQVLFLSSPPIQESYLGKTFHLIPYIQAADSHFTSLSIFFTKSYYCIFRSDEKGQEELSETEADIGMERATRWGDYHNDNREETSRNDSLIEGMQSMHTFLSHQKYEYLFFFYTQGYPEDEVRRHIEKELGDIHPRGIFLAQRNVSDERKLYPYILEKIRSVKKERLTQLFDSALSDRTKIATSFSEMVHSTQMRNCDVIFASNETDQLWKGYVDENGVIYAEGGQGRVLTDNSFFWICFAVLRSAGSVYIIESLPKSNPYLLHLQYLVS